MLIFSDIAAFLYELLTHKANLFQTKIQKLRSFRRTSNEPVSNNGF